VSIEVPLADDAQPLPRWKGLDLRWMARAPGGHAYGAGMIEAARAAAIPESARLAVPGGLAAVDVDADILWDRAEPAGGGFYGWIAGETAAVSRIRSHLVAERGIDRRLLTMMGYWRFGKQHA
jgi:NADPH-dependent ferric siderophore reductase